MSKIKKIRVSSAVFWVEIPDAQLYILCGCPADSVKHLMKRGLIVTTEEDGIPFETGPNAILLSDVMVQKENFANMAEFPVLQMLYRQGMILPNHPNNTGVKPLLIGAEEQVKSQMAYIYRGNYGLISEKEIEESGITLTAAHEMMRLKLKFAFGNIRSTADLIDSRFIKNERLEIRNQVFIRRVRLNVFEFQYQGESVTVDLNLATGETYDVPYPLGFHQIKREYFAVIHSGEGDGWDINRPCMASILMFQGKIYLIDAGPNLFNSLLSLGIGISEIEGIFHTHAHDDHFAGLTTLMRADHRIKYFAVPLVRASVVKKLSALIDIDDDSFSDYFDIKDLEFNRWNQIEGLEVRPVFSPHPVETSILFFRTLWEGGYRSYAHLADIVALDILEDMITSDPTAPGITPEYFDLVKQEYLTSAHLKKIDIGGGMIHGKAEDFLEDSSDKIILSHSSQELTIQQKQIGSGATFGTVDILIPTTQDFAQRYAFEYLRSYFPSAPLHQTRILLNNPVITFNPGSILLKQGQIAQEMFLILTGYVEQILSDSAGINMLSAGALVGEMSGMMQRPTTNTFRAASFVQALRLPANLYAEIMRQSGLFKDFEQLREKRKFLQDTWLLGDGISSTTQTKLSQQIELHRYPAGHEFSTENGTDLFLVREGQLEQYIGGNLLETLEAGNFFGEDELLGIPYLFEVRAVDAVEIFLIPGKALLTIPIVHWKLFETLKRRRRLLFLPEEHQQSIFVWREEYSVKNQEMDDDHKRIIKQADKLIKVIKTGEDNKTTGETLAVLLDYTQNHFKSEESLLKKIGYLGLQGQERQHRGFIRRIAEIRELLQGDKFRITTDFSDFFKEWFVHHILTEDRKYINYLN